MAGRQASSAVTRYAGIQVQTSSAGLQIPVGWGTFRCKCNLLDYLDFTSTPQKAAAAGKGGATVTGYTYTASIVLGVCEGPIDAITQVWVDSSDYAYNSNGSTVANTGSTPAVLQAQLGLATGPIGQPAWAYLTSAHADHAIGYSGLAIVYAEHYALDTSASTPNHSFEVVRQAGFAVGGGYTGPDADPSLVVSDFFNNTRTGVPSWAPGLLDTVSLSSAADSYQAYCLAAGLLVSPVIDQERSATDFLTELLLATNATVVWSEGLLKFVPYGDTPLSANGKTYTPDLTPVYALDDDDFVVDKAGTAPVSCEIKDQSDAYNVVQLEYLDRTNQYNMAIALASDAANVAQYGMRRQDPTTVHCICTPAAAATAAQLYLQRTLYVRAEYKFKLGWMFALLEPGDIVELTDLGMGLNAYPVRITQLDEDEKYGLTITAEDLLAGVSHAPLYAMQTGQAPGVNGAVDPGGVEAQLLAAPNSFTNAVWTANDLTVTSGAATDPYYGSGAGASSIVPTTTANVQHGLIQQFTGFPDANYTFSIWLKADGYTGALLALFNNGATDIAWVQFDLSAGTVSGQGIAVGSPNLIGGTTTAWGSGWYRCSITAAVPAGSPATDYYSALFPTQTGAGGWYATAFTANGTSGLLAFGAQTTQGVDVRDAWCGAPSGPLLFNPPIALTPAGIETWVAASGGPNWGGANVYVSLDGGANYSFVETINGDGRYGFIDATFGSGGDPDTSNTISVDLGPSGGDLTSAADAVADQSGTLCLVGGTELVAFSTAALVDKYQYGLGGYLRRGVLGTPIGSHGPGATFIRLDDQVTSLPYLPTQAGQTAYVKFQSFNLLGRSPTPLENCVAYTVAPLPLGATSPGSAAWSAVGTTLSNGGNSIPAIVVSGMSDNASATGIDFEYRQTGTSTWISAGVANANCTQKVITSVASGQQYDVSVVYIVGGVPSEREIIASALAVGTFVTPGTGGGGGSSPGAILLNDTAPGTSKTFTCPAGSYAHIDILLVGPGGPGNGNGTGKGAIADYGGGGGMSVVVASFPVTPGTTVLTYDIYASGTGVTCTATGLSLAASNGGASSGFAGGAGGSTSGITNTATGATSVTNNAGHAGALVNTWDGGGAWLPTNPASSITTGGYTDNTNDGTPGSLAGQGGAGTVSTAEAGGGSQLLIVARA